MHGDHNPKRRRHGRQQINTQMEIESQNVLNILDITSFPSWLSHLSEEILHDERKDEDGDKQMDSNDDDYPDQK